MDYQGFREYPKIETIFDRDQETFAVRVGAYRHPAFALIPRWRITEKIDGMNVRICLDLDGEVSYFGRTDDTQMHPGLIVYLQTKFPPARLQEILWSRRKPEEPTFPAVIFGEAYGPKIQKGGIYRNDFAVRIFDVLIAQWWLDWQDVNDVAEKLGMKTVPDWGLMGTADAIALVGPCDASLKSSVAFEDKGDGKVLAEGIVASCEPMLFDKQGNRIMWKLKRKDFQARGKRGQPA